MIKVCFILSIVAEEQFDDVSGDRAKWRDLREKARQALRDQRPYDQGFRDHQSRRKDQSPPKASLKEQAATRRAIVESLTEGPMPEGLPCWTLLCQIPLKDNLTVVNEKRGKNIHNAPEMSAVEKVSQTKMFPESGDDCCTTLHPAR